MECFKGGFRCAGALAGDQGDRSRSTGSPAADVPPISAAVDILADRGQAQRQVVEDLQVVDADSETCSGTR
jgi:hypothetical protein